ncbi:FHA domain-containing protein [Nostoc sp. MG11]|uniref:FHA domain-containing protein n=1 Tax=Nostoc sp. MG11 TaxID=2721166 RepID=UPI0018682876|nr:FHA domain-containing protein [Nostoc sp. MG11]
MNASTLQWAITFQWNDVSTGNLKTQQISKQQVSKHNHAIIIGRDNVVCDIVINDSSVSKEHVKIYCDEQIRRFIIKNLRDTNIPKVDDEDLAIGKELPLKLNSKIVLGTQKIEIIDIQIYELESTNYSGLKFSSKNSSLVNPNQNSNPVNSNKNSSSVNPNPNSSPVNPDSTSNKPKHWWQEPTIQVAIIGAIVTLVGSILTLNANIMSQKTEEIKQRVQLQADKLKQQEEFKIEKQKLYNQKFSDHRQKVREIKETMRQKKEFYNQLTLKTNDSCPNTVRVAISFTALDDVSETRGWINVEPGGLDRTPGGATIYAGVFLHAKTSVNNEEIIWEPTKTGRIERFVEKKEFNYIQEPFLDANIEEKPVKFYEVKLERKITKKAFNCNAGTLQLVDAE